MIRGLSVPGLLRSLAVVLAALVAVALGSRGVGLVPDLVLPVVVAGALLRGPSSGALLGLAAGWVVDLMPPGSQLLGSSALLYAAAGLVAGAGRREGRAPIGWVALVVASSAVVLAAGRVAAAVLAAAPVAWVDTGLWLGQTTALGILAVPPLLWAEQALARRRPA